MAKEVKRTFEEALERIGLFIQKRAKEEFKTKPTNPLKHAEKLLQDIKKMKKALQKLKRQYGNRDQIKELEKTLNKYEKDIAESRSMLKQIDTLENHLFFVVMDKKSVLGIYTNRFLALFNYFKGKLLFALCDALNGTQTDFSFCIGTKKAADSLGVSEAVFLEHFAKEIKRIKKI